MAVAGVVFCLCFIDSFSMITAASNSKDCLDDLNVGVAVILDPSAYDHDANKQEIVKLQDMAKGYEETKKEESDLFMADVKIAMNVREEPSEEASKVGLLYKDCGGRVLEKGEGWSRIKSGDLVGWASNDYLLFGDEAETLAREVGFELAVVNTESLRLRKEPSEKSGIVCLLAKGDTLEVDGEAQDGWLPVSYDGETAYVSADYVVMDLQIDAGETLKAIEER